MAGETETMGQKIWAFVKLPVQIMIAITVVSFVDHFATKPAIHSLESLIGKK